MVYLLSMNCRRQGINLHHFEYHLARKNNQQKHNNNIRRTCFRRFSTLIEFQKGWVQTCSKVKHNHLASQLTCQNRNYCLSPSHGHKTYGVTNLSTIRAQTLDIDFVTDIDSQALKHKNYHTQKKNYNHPQGFHGH